MLTGFHCNTLPFSCLPSRRSRTRTTDIILSALSKTPRFTSACRSSVPIHPTAFNFPTRRFSKVVSALVSEENAVATDVFKLTYLEGNSWLWDLDGVKVLVDPILVGNLDFGIPWLFDAGKKFLKSFQVTYVEPGQSSEIEGRNGSKLRVKATAGPVLGPPWQRPENGYLVNSSQGQLTLYYEPHCVYNQNFLEKERSDIVITPVIKQLLPKFTLVSGQEDAVKLAKLLHAKFIVPMKNGDLDSKGFLASIIQSEGTVESFKELLSKELPDAQLLEPTPGEPLEIPAPSDNP
ncbi:metallo-hydrolase/oxidoreductase superfamily protein [Citrus sinensis]|uniref:uncharacterized protein LOC102624335 isoform X2 n=1 Tax=Citrus sinensis TaxID=2711 RepID=UPI000D62D9F0|nr:uncharacterized protein LOC102624335 isoform X2 [Citrus sinensis]KAH9707520.1 metallo-hydrolase/oxidoreductase superfamily protein [Citrus sinensis]